MGILWTSDRQLLVDVYGYRSAKKRDIDPQLDADQCLD